MTFFWSFLVLAFLLSNVEESRAFNIKFHFHFTNIGYYVDHQVVYNGDSKSAFMVYNTTETDPKTESSIRTAVASDLDTWTDKGNINFVKNADHIFFVNDDEGSSGFFGSGKSGYVLAFQYRNNRRDFLYRENNDDDWTKPKTVLTGITPLSWITPIWNKPTKTWISEKWGEIISSPDLIVWKSDSKLNSSTLPDYKNNYKQIQELFNIAVEGKPSQVFWVAYIRKWPSKESFCFIGDIVEDVLTFSDPPLTFDYGRDYNELAIIGGEKYGEESKIGLGTVKNEDFPEIKDDTYSAYPRIITLVTDSGNKYLKFKPIAAARKPSFILTDTSMTSALLSSVSSSHFRIDATISFSDDDSFGFQASTFKFGYDTAKKEFFLNISDVTNSRAPLRDSPGQIDIQGLVDGGIVEIFGNGEITITALTVPSTVSSDVTAFAGKHTTKIVTASVYNYA